MAKKIVIDNYIGNYYFSKQFIREMLKGVKDEVEVVVSSLGGDLDHAIDIHNQFAENGNVIINFTGFNASSATVISLGAKKVRMCENSFYLIHKALVWIDKFGYYNEDDFDELIADLSKKKDQSAKITLTVAKMYADKSGMAVKEVLALMKEEIWLTAEEAKEKGFVDEVYKASEVTNLLEDSTKMAMIAASGYPVPGRKKVETPENSTEVKTPVDEEGIFQRILNKVKDHLNPHKNEMSKPDLKRLNEILKAANIMNFSVNSDGTVTLTADMATAIEGALEQEQTAKAALQQKVDESANLNTKVTDLESKLQTANNRIKELEKEPGASSATVNNETDSPEGKETDGGFWERFANLSPKKK